MLRSFIGNDKNNALGKIKTLISNKIDVVAGYPYKVSIINAVKLALSCIQTNTTFSNNRINYDIMFFEELMDSKTEIGGYLQEICRHRYSINSIAFTNTANQLLNFIKEYESQLDINEPIEYVKSYIGFQSSIPQMSDSERFLAMRMIQDYKIQVTSENARRYINLTYADDLKALYRPGVGSNNPVSTTIHLDSSEMQTLEFLNGGNFDIYTQFSNIGYTNNNGMVEFNMVHPIICYLFKQHTIFDENFNGIGMTEININVMFNFFGEYLNTYNYYTNNKIVVDRVLLKVYNQANTLYIAEDNGASRNGII